MSDQFNTQPTEGFETPTPGSEQGATEEKLGSAHREHARLASKRPTPEEVGEAAIKFAREAALAATGAANLLAVKAREFYEEQRKQLADKTPEGVDPNFRQFVDTMPDQFKTFIDEAVKVYHDLAERGKAVVDNLQGQAQKLAETPPKTPGEHVEAFDLNEDAAATHTAEQAAAPEQPLVSDATDYPPVADVYPGEAKGEQRY